MIPARAVSLLFRHLPQLVTVIFVGLAGRQAVIWLAVWLSTFSSLAVSLVMALAPLMVMLSIIFSLWLLRPSLPFLSATFPDRKDGSSRVRLLSAGGMLISFLTVYSTHGLLKEDLAAFRRATTYDEYFNQGFGVPNRPPLRRYSLPSETVTHMWQFSSTDSSGAFHCVSTAQMVKPSGVCRPI